MNFYESSLQDLYLSTLKAFPTTTKRQHAVDPIVVENIRWVPYKGVKTLFVKGKIRNESNHYNTIILFKNIDYKKNEVNIIASDNKKYSFNKISLRNNDVLLRCNCNDFKWRFNYFDHLDKSLYGRNNKSNEHKDIANPKRLPGMCKHIMATIRTLKDANIFSD